MDAEVVERILDQGFGVSPEERRAALSGSWEERELSKRPPVWQTVRRLAWIAAFRFARRLRPSKEEVDLLLVPVWYCDNVDNDDPGNDWEEASLLLSAGQERLLRTTLPITGTLTARGTRHGHTTIVESTAIAPSIALPYRNPWFCVLEGARVYQVFDGIAEHTCPPLDCSKRFVPPYSSAMESAIDLSMLGEAQRKMIESAISSDSGMSQ